MRQKFFFLLVLLCTCTIASAQIISTFQDNLTTPAGLEVDADGNVWVTQVGAGTNDGKISAIEPNGTIHDVIVGLPSVVNPANNETIGAWRTMQMPDNKLLVVSGEGSEPLSGSLLTYDLSGFTLGDAPLNASDYESAFNVQDFVFAQGYNQSNIYSVVMNAAGDMFIVDAAANAIIKRDIATDALSVFATFPDLISTFPPGPPRNQVPTKIISDGADGFYVGTLTGFPFTEGSASVQHVAADGTVSDFLGNLTMVTDLALNPTDGSLSVLEFANFGQGFIPNSARLLKVNAADSTYSIMAQDFGPAAAFVFDVNGDAYVSSIFAGAVLKIEMVAPANDALCNATPIMIGEDCNGIPNLNNNLATAEDNEPIFSCPSASSNSGDTTVRNSVWYSFVATANDVHIVVGADDISTQSPYQVSLFSLNGDCTNLTNLELLDCNVPVTNIQAGASIITSGLEEGETYYVQVSGVFFPFNGSTLFSAAGCLTISEVSIPTNDDACNAIELEVNAPAQIFSNVGATAEVGEIAISPPPAGNPLAIDSEGWALGTNFLDNSVWFTFTTPPQGGHIQVDLFSTIDLPANFNTQAAVYEVTDCGDFSTYTLVTSGDNSLGPELLSGQLFGSISASPRLDLFCTEGNKTYAVAVDGGNTFFFQPIRNQGLFSIAINTVAPPSPATIATSSPTFICAGDGEDDLIDVEVVDEGFGAEQIWVITDADLNILDLPAAPPFNLEGAGEGVCLIWYLNVDKVEGLEVGLNAADVTGCFELSNPIEIVRVSGDECEESDLELELYVDNELYNQYETVLYTVVVTNYSTKPATGVTVAAGLPEGMVYADDYAEVGEYDFFTETWKIDELAPGQTAYLDLELFTLVADVEITQFVQIMTADEEDIDSTPGNNTTQTPTEDDEGLKIIRPATNGGVGNGGDIFVDLELNVAGESSTYNNFETFVFTFTLTNNSEEDAFETQVNFDPSNNMVYTGNGIDPLSVSHGEFNGWFQTWKIDYLPAGETATLEIEVFPTAGDDALVFYAEIFTTLDNDDDSTPGNGTAPTANEDDEAVAVIAKDTDNFSGGSVQLAKGGGMNLTQGAYQLYPNPTPARLTIAHQSAGEYLINYQVRTVTGKLIRQYPVDMTKGLNTLEVDVSDLENGMYFIQIMGEDGASKNLRFTKMQE